MLRADIHARVLGAVNGSAVTCAWHFLDYFTNCENISLLYQSFNSLIELTVYGYYYNILTSNSSARSREIHHHPDNAKSTKATSFLSSSTRMLSMFKSL